MLYNQIHNVRPDSTFENFLPQDQTQETALATMKELASHIAENKGIFGAKRGEAPSLLSRFFNFTARDLCKDNDPHDNRPSSPFLHGSLFILSGSTGRGKTHLVEALMNRLRQTAPKAHEDIFFYKKSLFSLETGGGFRKTLTDNRNIIIFDDPFPESYSDQDLNKMTDISSFKALIEYLYEEKIVCILNTNFDFATHSIPLLQQGANENDKIVSRARELFARGGGGLVLEGPDYREIIATQQQENPERRINLFPKKPGKPSNG